LNALTRARTKVGDYAFTTLHPHVGVVEYEDYMQISIADLPGMLPDPTRGLGTGFLRHIERSKIVIFVIDLSSTEPLKQYYDMRKNLEFYDPDMFLKKPFIIVGSKVDLEDGKKNLAILKNEFEIPIIPMSSTERINITKFLIYLRNIYDNNLSK
jgi:GTP-binding protein